MLDRVKVFLRFILPKSLSRIEYTVRILGRTMAVVVLYLLRGLTDPIANIAMLLIWHYIAFFVIWPRLRDCGMSFIYVLLALVPLIYIFLFVILMFRPPKNQFRSAGDQATSQA
jgi:hypothetical protein